MRESGWVKIGTAGKTIDGRTIKEEWLDSMARNYSTDLYIAPVNVEHFFYPGLGFVTALEKRKDEQGRAGLYAKLMVTDLLMQITQEGRKLFRSIEPVADFPRDGDVYLAALAITDTPASQGLPVHQFTRDRETMPPLRMEGDEDLFRLEVEQRAGEPWFRKFWEQVMPRFRHSPTMTQSNEDEMTDQEKKEFEALKGRMEDLERNFKALPASAPEAQEAPVISDPRVEQLSQEVAALKGTVEKFSAFMAETKSTEALEVTGPAEGGETFRC